MPVRFAYFIMVHHLPAQFEWLMNAIHDPEDLFLIHVDMKSRLGLKANRRGVMREVRRIIADRPNVRLLPSRFTNWGGWSLSQILLDAIRIALRSDVDWRYFINLSGQCYPLKPLETIRRELAEAGDQLYVQMTPVGELPPDDWHHKARPMLETPFRAIVLPGRKAEPTDFALSHKGSQWVILPRTFCEWMLTAPLTRKVSRYLSGRLLSDELVMQTLVANGPFREKLAPHYGREIVWPGPKVMREEDWSRLTESDAWFARKFNLEQDVVILERLALLGGYTPGPSVSAQ